MSIYVEKPIGFSSITGADAKRAALVVALVALAVAAALSVGWAGFQALGAEGSRDNQWSGAHILWQGLDPSRLFIACRAGGCADDPFILSQYPNYPISVLALFTPLGALPWGVAKFVWLAVNLLSSAVLLRCVWREWAPKFGRVALLFALLLFLVATPFRNHIENGQVGLLALAAFALSREASTRRRTTLAGLFLALAWTKFTLTLPLSLIFVARRDWRVVAIAGAVHVGLTLAASAWTGTDPIASAFGFLRVARLAIHEQYGYLDLFSFAIRVGLPGMVAGAAAMALFGALLYGAWRGGKDREPLLLSVASLASIAIFYHLSYDCVILLFPFLYALHLAEESRLELRSALFAALVLAAVFMIWFGNRLIGGNENGYAYGSAGYHLFYWVMESVFYAAIAVGLYALLKTRANATSRASFAASRGLAATR